ncbi:hypothetical protein ACFV3R_16260 [Streptomyces sp. NPDC059740]|uniref:hypothetical protein n=1 Tax=Streptomyces sp. NPDC059740 TaxID=3346926 RepID=UPI003648FCCB
MVLALAVVLVPLFFLLVTNYQDSFLYRLTHRRAFAEQRERDELYARMQEEHESRRVERERLEATRREQRDREVRRDPEWREKVYDHFLRWHFAEADASEEREQRLFWNFRGTRLTQDEVEKAGYRATREGYLVQDREKWRLTRRGRRIFEEYGGDRKRMDEAEKQRRQPHIRIDARGAGTVAHTIHGGVHGTTVNNAWNSPPPQVDLRAALQMVHQLREALATTDDLSDLARGRASGDLGEVDRELNAPADERDPRRVRTALENLRTTLAGTNGLIEVVNKLWDHLHAWFAS